MIFLLATGTVLSLRETTLAGNQFLEDAVRLTWTKEGEVGEAGKVDEVAPVVRQDVPEGAHTEFVTNLKPMQIRTFVVEVS